MITVSGIGSGLDIESLVSQLVAAERTPSEGRLVRQDSRLTAELSGFGQLKSALSSFQSSVSSLDAVTAFSQRTAASTNPDVLDITASSSAASGNYSVEVSQLASAHSLASGSYASVTDTVGTGELTFRFGTTDYTGPEPGPESYNGFAVNPDRGIATLTIDSSNNTLEGLRDAINEADFGVSATIVNDGSGYRLLLNSAQTGAENSIEISVNDTGDSNNTDANGLSALAFNASASNIEQTAAAADAVFSINGLSINSATNRVSNAIDGVDITLKSVSDGSPVTASVITDRAGVKEALNDFVDGYNQFITTTNRLTAFDAATGSAGALQGDFSVRSIVGQLRQTLASAVDGFNGPFTSISEIGFTTNADGTLSINNTLLDSALESNFDDIVGLFAAAGFPEDDGVEFVNATDDTQIGSYAVEVTQLASQGQLVTGAIGGGFPLTIDADNDNLTVRIDGVTSQEIALTQGVYDSGEALAAELQARINGEATIAGSSARVNVSFATDRFEITSDSFGGNSQVEILTVDTNSAGQLGLSAATGVSGQNIAGSIGGAIAIGSGQQLTGAAESSAAGLALRIQGGDLGARGAVDFSRGVAAQLNSLLESFLASDGILESRTEGINERVDDIEEAREKLERRMEVLETSLRARFTTLDTLLASLQTTSDFLTQQLASLPEPNSINRN